MHILVAYATNSGSTYLVAKRISEVLQTLSHTTDLRDITTLTPADLSPYDLYFFGSNSWDFQGKEGQPQHKFIHFLETAQAEDWTDKKFAVFGCGDKTYMIFCGAVQVISDFITAHHGTIINEPLKINQFYLHDQDEVYTLVEEWTKKTLVSVQ